MNSKLANRLYMKETILFVTEKGLVIRNLAIISQL